MLKQWLPTILGVLILSTIVVGYNSVYEFDANENIIISTTVYNTTGQPCINCDCNITIFEPYPNESIVRVNSLMENKSNGVYIYNATGNLTYNKHLYPMTLVCSDGVGFFGGDDRTGIKVSETLFDFSSLIIGLVAIGGLLLFASYKIDEKFKEKKIFIHLISWIFFIGAIFVGLQIARSAPNSEDFIIIYDALFYGICIIYLIYAYFTIKDFIVSNFKFGKSAISGKVHNFK